MKNIVAMSSANIENIRKGKFFRLLESDKATNSETICQSGVKYRL